MLSGGERPPEWQQHRRRRIDHLGLGTLTAVCDLMSYHSTSYLRLVAIATEKNLSRQRVLAAKGVG